MDKKKNLQLQGERQYFANFPFYLPETVIDICLILAFLK